MLFSIANGGKTTEYMYDPIVNGYVDYEGNQYSPYGDTSGGNWIGRVINRPIEDDEGNFTGDVDSDLVWHDARPWLGYVHNTGLYLSDSTGWGNFGDIHTLAESVDTRVSYQTERVYDAVNPLGRADFSLGNPTGYLEDAAKFVATGVGFGLAIKGIIKGVQLGYRSYQAYRAAKSSQYITVYRGVNSAAGSSYQNAFRGVVKLRGGRFSGHSNRMLHNAGPNGTVNSRFTSWTTDIDVALNYAYRTNGNGVLLKMRVPAAKIIENPNTKVINLFHKPGQIVSESEILLRGTLRTKNFNIVNFGL